MIANKTLEHMIDKFIFWHDSYGDHSYDNADSISSNIGQSIKKLWLKNKIIGTPFMAFLHMVDILAPRLINLISEKRRHDIADAHFALAYLGLYKYYNDTNYLVKSKTYVNQIISNVSETKFGKGWGQPWIWVTPNGIVPRNSPVVTNTAYCFDALNSYSKIEKNHQLDELFEKILNFLLFDLKGTKISNKAEDSIYGFNFPAKAYNATAYRAKSLLTLGKILSNNNSKIIAKNNINYIISNQNDDGSWFYSEKSLYIDNIHTCFILKNLIECYNILKQDNIKLSIEKGYYYYKENLIKNCKTPKHFAKVRYPKFRKIEMYDYAEAINLEIEMNNVIRKPDYKLLNNYIIELKNKYQLEEGYFITRINSFNMKNKIPYLGWPQSQLFNSLVKLLNHTKK